MATPVARTTTPNLRAATETTFFFTLRCAGRSKTVWYPVPTDVRHCRRAELDGSTGLRIGPAYDLPARAPRARRRRLLERGPGGARPSTARDHRPLRIRPPAHERSGRPLLDRFQRRDLQLPAIAPRARSRRRAIRQPER